MNAVKPAFTHAVQSEKRNVGVSGPSPETKETASPFSLRLTADERAYLNEQAGSQPLGAYIRRRLLGERQHRRRHLRRPQIEEQKLALVLAELGRSRLSSNLNQLAKAANMGTLDSAPDVEQELREACRAVLFMRNALIEALGLKAEAGQ